MMGRFRTERRRFACDQDGGAQSIEFAIWLPIFFGILSIMIDATTMLRAHAVAYNVAGDAVRRWVQEDLSTPSAVRTWAASQGTFHGHAPTVTANETNGVKSVTLDYDMSQIDVVGGLIAFTPSNRLTASASAWAE